MGRMEWDTFKIIAIICAIISALNAIVAISDKAYTYGKPAYTSYKKNLKY